VQRQGPRNAHPLLLPARKLARAMMRSFLEIDQLQTLQGTLLSGGARLACDT
jgi:hypothetical protein